MHMQCSDACEVGYMIIKYSLVRVLLLICTTYYTITIYGFKVLISTYRVCTVIVQYTVWIYFPA